MVSTIARHPHRFDRLVSKAADGRTLWACSVDARCIETSVVALPVSATAATPMSEGLRREVGR